MKSDVKGEAISVEVPVSRDKSERVTSHSIYLGTITCSKNYYRDLKKYKLLRVTPFVF